MLFVDYFPYVCWTLPISESISDQQNQREFLNKRLVWCGSRSWLKKKQCSKILTLLPWMKTDFVKLGYWCNVSSMHKLFLICNLRNIKKPNIKGDILKQSISLTVSISTSPSFFKFKNFRVVHFVIYTFSCFLLTFDITLIYLFSLV